MFSFEPTEEQRMLVEAISRYALSDLRAKAHDADEGNQFSKSLIEKGWQMGLLQASIPEAYGGFGERSVVTGALAAEAMAWGDLAGALTVMTPGLFAMPLLIGGSEEQKKEYLPPVIEAGWSSYTAAMIEPFYDFDPNEPRCTAVEHDGTYVLDGVKGFVPFAADALAMIVYARLGEATQGFIVAAGTPGLTIGEQEKLLGVRALPMYKLTLNRVRVPHANRLGGPEGHDFAPILAASRVALAAMAVGLSRAALEYACAYAKDRDVFGVKVAQKQTIAFMIAEMATEIEAIRLLTWEAAWMLDNSKEEAFQRAYLAHSGALDMAMMVTDRAVQILGGHGYIREHPVELWMRNGRGISTLTGLAIV